MKQIQKLLHEQIAEAWGAADSNRLLKIATEISSTDPESALVVEGIAYECRGQTLDAFERFQSLCVIKDPTFEQIRTTGMFYCATKLKRQSERVSTWARLKYLVKAIFLPTGPLKSMAIHRYLYAWYITAFWYDQKQSLLSALFLLLFSRINGSRETRAHGQFLLGHVLNVMGRPGPGVPLVVAAYKAKEQIRPWQRNAFFSYMSYGFNVVGRCGDLIPGIIEDAEASLNTRPDSFYQVLHLVTRLRFASQMGDVQAAESVGSRLIELSEKTGNERFYYSTKADMALCYGIRGILWKCEELLEELKNYNPSPAQPIQWNREVSTDYAVGQISLSDVLTTPFRMPNGLL